MKSYMFEVRIEPDDFDDGTKAFHGWCPALKGCHTWGYTVDETMIHLNDAIGLYIQSMIDNGEPLPETDTGKGVAVMAAPAVLLNVA